MEIKKVLIYPEFDLLEELKKARDTTKYSWSDEAKAIKKQVEKIIEIVEKSGATAFYEAEQGKLTTLK